MSSFEKFWLKSCDKQKIPPEIAKNWLKTIQTKYNTESNRIYHNFNVLTKKCDFLESLNTISFSDYLIMAIAFQYYHFDLKMDCSESNCSGFREFCNAAAVNDVSFQHFTVISIASEIFLISLYCLMFLFLFSTGVWHVQAQLIDSVCHLLGDTNKTYSGNAQDIELFQDLDLIVLG